MSGLRITRSDAAPRYSPPLHRGVAAFRLQGHEAGETGAFWLGLSYYLPGGAAEESATAQETVYVVLEGELTVSADGRRETLRPFDSAHLPKGTLRGVENLSARPATLLVAVATPPPDRP